jgi:hypothetical protein
VDALITEAQGLVEADQLKDLHEKLNVAVDYMQHKKDGGNRLGVLKACKECIKRRLSALDSNPFSQKVFQETVVA